MSTATEKALKAKADMESLFQAAIDEQLEIIREAEARLLELGHTSAPKKGKTITRQRDPNKPCGICNFVTDPPHDGRAHKNRSQKPFNADELKELGFKKKAASA